MPDEPVSCCPPCRSCYVAGVSASDSSALASATRPGDKMTGRYYQCPNQDTKASVHSKAEARASDADKEREQLLASFEQKVAAEPHNEELWMLFALQHIDFGAVNSLKGMIHLMCAEGSSVFASCTSAVTMHQLQQCKTCHRL